MNANGANNMELFASTYWEGPYSYNINPDLLMAKPFYRPLISEDGNLMLLTYDTCFRLMDPISGTTILEEKIDFHTFPKITGNNILYSCSYRRDDGTCELTTYDSNLIKKTVGVMSSWVLGKYARSDKPINLVFKSVESQDPRDCLFEVYEGVDLKWSTKGKGLFFIDEKYFCIIGDQVTSIREPFNGDVLLEIPGQYGVYGANSNITVLRPMIRNRDQPSECVIVDLAGMEIIERKEYPYPPSLYFNGVDLLSIAYLDTESPITDDQYTIYIDRLKKNEHGYCFKQSKHDIPAPMSGNQIDVLMIDGDIVAFDDYLDNKICIYNLSSEETLSEYDMYIGRFFKFGDYYMISDYASTALITDDMMHEIVRYETTTRNVIINEYDSHRISIRGFYDYENNCLGSTLKFISKQTETIEPYEIKISPLEFIDPYTYHRALVPTDFGIVVLPTKKSNYHGFRLYRRGASQPTYHTHTTSDYYVTTWEYTNDPGVLDLTVGITSDRLKFDIISGEIRFSNK